MLKTKLNYSLFFAVIEWKLKVEMKLESNNHLFNAIEFFATMPVAQSCCRINSNFNKELITSLISHLQSQIPPKNDV